MFTVSQIDEAHAKVKSGADFPRYVVDLSRLGVRRYVTFVADGHTDYHGDRDFSASSPASYPAKTIAPLADSDTFKSRLKAHQQGESTYPQFCTDCAELGIDRWEVDIAAMTCTYFDRKDDEVVVERIPAAGQGTTS